MLDDKQQTIGFEHREREELALIRSITSIQDTDLTPGRLSGVRRLIETIYICSTSHVSYAREKVLAEKAVGGPVDKRTVRNWVRDAKALGVLFTWPRPGQASSGKRIEIDRIRELVRRPRREETISSREETISCREEIISSLRVSPLRSPNSRPPPPPTPATTWQTAEEEEVIAMFRKAGLADSEVISEALTRGWTADGLRKLLQEFNERRPTWGDSIRRPLGLLHKWLQTLAPDDPIPWPESVIVKPYQPTLTVEEEARKYADAIRTPLLGKGTPEKLDAYIRHKLREEGFRPEVIAAAGYPDPQAETAPPS